jgi:hypothetical protein
MYAYHSIWYLQRVQRTLIRNPEIIRLRLDPAKCELRALLDNLEKKFQLGIVRVCEFGTHFAKRIGELEMPTTRSCDALDGHNRTLTHPSHDETPNDSLPRLPLTS